MFLVSVSLSVCPSLPMKLYIETVGCQMNELDSELVVGALLGIPIGYKDIYFTRGIKTTAGSALLADWVPDVKERQKLMQEHMQTMQENMKAMRGMGGPMMKGGGMAKMMRNMKGLMGGMGAAMQNLGPPRPGQPDPAAMMEAVDQVRLVRACALKEVPGRRMGRSRRRFRKDCLNGGLRGCCLMRPWPKRLANH